MNLRTAFLHVLVFLAVKNLPQKSHALILQRQSKENPDAFKSFGVKTLLIYIAKIAKSKATFLVALLFISILIYFSATSSFILYMPLGLPLKNSAALTAPTANTSLERAECESVIISSRPANITSCSPTMVPPLIA